jgi:S1-C subfamily serine protease
VVQEIVPGGPASDALRVGDVLVRVNSRMVTTFLPLEDELDASVGDTVHLEVERGGVPHHIEMTVQDLFEITPDEYIEVGGAVVHPVSYQQARNFSVPAAGLYLASNGYMFSRADVPRGAVLTAVGGVLVETLDDLEAVLSSLPDGERVPVRYFQIGLPHNESVGVIRLDRRWHPMRRCARDARTGRWPCTDLPASRIAAPAKPATASFPVGGERPARRLARSLGMVEFDIPFRADGIHGDHFRGTGLVVDAEKGLVVVDRETVPISLGDVYVTFGASVQVPGEVVFVHPTHNFSVVSYDPALVGDTPVRAAKLRRKGLEPGETVWLVGLSERDQLVTRKTTVSRVEPPVLALTDPPRFRESNLDVVAVADTTPTVGGVLADRWGRVYALWSAFTVQEGKTTAAFWGGIPSERILDVVTPLREGRPVNWRSLGVELNGLTLADARSRGFDEEAARQLESRNGTALNVLSVLRSTAGTPAADLLQEGDLLLSVAGEPASSLARVERASQAETVDVSVLRDGEQLDLDIPTAPLDGRGTDRVVLWAGALLQAPHLAVAAQRGIASGEGVYVSWFWYGSPANRYGIRATRRIVEVDGVPTPDLDAFLAAVADRPDRGPVRLRTLHLDGKEEVITLKLDLQFWPTVELRRTAGRWVRLAH